MTKAILKKAFLMSARIAGIVAAIGIIYGFVTKGAFTLKYAFTANFWVGITIFLGGLLILITPTALLIKKSRLIDHTTYGQKFMEERDRKRVRACELIYIGMCNILITGSVQLVVWSFSQTRPLVF